MSLQKNRLRSAKNVIFALMCILVDRPIEGFEPPTPKRLNPQTSLQGIAMGCSHRAAGRKKAGECNRDAFLLEGTLIKWSLIWLFT